MSLLRNSCGTKADYHLDKYVQIYPLILKNTLCYTMKTSIFIPKEIFFLDPRLTALRKEKQEQKWTKQKLSKEIRSLHPRRHYGKSRQLRGDLPQVFVVSGFGRLRNPSSSSVNSS